MRPETDQAGVVAEPVDEDQVPDPTMDLMIDPVTGAYPRALLDAHLERELAAAAAGRGSCSVFLFDIDFFKTVNDAYGHQRGDRVLHELADLIKRLVRRADALFRYGGDEFVLILPGTGAAEAVRLALRLTDGVHDHSFGGEPPLRLSISLGVATFPADGGDVDGLLGCADRRNYLAKRRGRGGVVADDIDTEAGTGVGPIHADGSTVAAAAGGARGAGGFGEVSSRLWERDNALRTVHDFLTRLRVTGQERWW